jgi:hypothetical protein
MYVLVLIAHFFLGRLEKFDCCLEQPWPVHVRVRNTRIYREIQIDKSIEKGADQTAKYSRMVIISGDSVSSFAMPSPTVFRSITPITFARYATFAAGNKKKTF